MHCNCEQIIPIHDLNKKFASTSSRSMATSHFGSSASSSSVTIPRKNVAKSLFGGPDARNDEFVRKRLKEFHVADRQKYNFDFDKEIPLEGRFKWEPIGSTSGSGFSLSVPSVLPESKLSSSSSTPEFSLIQQASVPVLGSSVSQSSKMLSTEEAKSDERVGGSSSQDSVQGSSSCSPATILSSSSEDLSIPTSLQVESSVESSEEDPILPKFLKRDSTIALRPKPTRVKQAKINSMFREVRKRHVETSDFAVVKKKASM